MTRLYHGLRLHRPNPNCFEKTDVRGGYFKTGLPVTVEAKKRSLVITFQNR